MRAAEKLSQAFQKQMTRGKENSPSQGLSMLKKEDRSKSTVPSIEKIKP